MKWLNLKTDDPAIAHLLDFLHQLNFTLQRLHEINPQQLFLQDLWNSENIQTLLLNVEILLEQNDFNTTENINEEFFHKLKGLMEILLNCFNQTSFSDQSLPNLENLVSVDINAWKEQGKILLDKLNEQLAKVKNENHIPV